MLFLGDFNADPGFTSSSTALGNSNEQGIILNRYLVSWGYVSAFLHPRFIPPVSTMIYTYSSEAHGSSSCIDHLLRPGDWIDSVVCDGKVLYEHPLNLSDHFPVSATLCVSLNDFPMKVEARSEDSSAPCTNWRRCNPDLVSLHQSRVICALPEVPHSWSLPSIDGLVQDMTEVLKASAVANFPPRQIREA